MTLLAELRASSGEHRKMTGEARMRLRQASVTAALSLLILAATTQAEGAWVLWERWLSQQSQQTGDSWTALGSEASEWACNRAREKEYAQAVRKGIERNGQALNVGYKTFIFYTCLPGTMDPHGAKTQ
jgi:hypothetical protein